RYVERNPVRANLVESARQWSWSSLGATNSSELSCQGPVARPRDWDSFVNSPQTEEELLALRRCTLRSAPFGDKVWTTATARQLGLESSLRPPGRPKKP
ncbi:MAG: hypothetical protein KJN72_00890, partial [Woeseia sp.]|nr:hypothetical protein [Woeseia sp.]